MSERTVAGITLLFGLVGASGVVILGGEGSGSPTYTQNTERNAVVNTDGDASPIQEKEVESKVDVEKPSEPDNELQKPGQVTEAQSGNDLEGNDARSQEGVSPKQISSGEIDIKGVVAIECEFWNQYLDETGGQGVRKIAQGSGVIISSDGHILTANHVLDPGSLNEDTTTGSPVWYLKKCDYALADDVEDAFVDHHSTTWKETEVFFQPDADEYLSNKLYDFAVLKGDESDSYNELFSNEISVSQEEESITVHGYPGLATDWRKFETKTLETRFEKIVSCIDEYSPNCEIATHKYFIRYDAYAPGKYFATSEEEREKIRTEESKLDFRGTRPGFSGSPVFFRGNLVGIVTHGDPYGELSGTWVLSSYSIKKLLQEKGVTL